MTATLEVHDLVKRFGGVDALAGIGFDLDEGEFTAMIGPNGAGKSTCFNVIDGQLRPDGGTVRLDGRDVSRADARRMNRLGVGRTFQVAAAFASLSVADNLRAAIIARENRARQVWPRAHRLYREEVDGLLSRVGLTDAAARQAALLAYGDIKRLELAIALAGRPRVLLMDEPTAGMAPAERRQLMELVRSIAGEEGLTVLFTEHDMDVVFDHAARIIVLDRGRILADGTPAEVRRNAKVRESYLGSGFGGGDAEPE
ncbi:MAG: ABC transporter ATP-binding protein [Rhodovibrionaceae bacterium]|nr:ABC transporter ATP-binding protein [Rhodovibrionaceae bacterium]